MNVRFFLEHLQKKPVKLQAVTCFYGKQYPLLFCSFYISFLFRHGITVERCSLVDRDSNEADTLFSMQTITGNTTYWLSDFYTLSLKKQQEWLLYFKSYTGPHTILLFCSDEAVSILSSSVTCHRIPLDTFVISDFRYMRLLVNNVGTHVTDFSHMLSTCTDRISLDTAILLVYYEACVGKSVTPFFMNWFSALVEPTTSFFLLSQYLFAKKKTLFFKQWALVAEQYAPQFWVVFWSDQLWRASAYCSLMKENQHVQAKKAKEKLPFSFIKSDWLLYSVSELQNAHCFLYTIDLRLKNGGDPIALEYFYSQFFTHVFKEK